MQKTKLNFPLVFLFILPDMPSVSQSTPIYQRAYHGQASQRWEIKMVDYMNGYYTIGKTVNETTYYLGLANNTPSDGANIVLRSGTVTDGMLWKIEKLPSGNFKIKSKLQIPGSSQELVMAVSWSENQSADGLQIKALLYSNDNYNTDEWELNRNVLRINVLADQGYVERFGETSYLDRIHECMQSAQSYFFTNFGVTIVYDDVELIQSYADQCTTATSLDDIECSCPGINDCSQHHKNVDAILDEFPFSESHCVLLFSGHNTCLPNGNGVHCDSALSGRAWTFWPEGIYFGTAIIVNFSSDYRQEIKTVVHEINHWYGVKDHYDDVRDDGDNAFTTEEINEKYGVNYYHTNCIHGERKDKGDVYPDLVTCEGCARTVRANASRFQHE